jgi:hypothetical protein
VAGLNRRRLGQPRPEARKDPAVVAAPRLRCRAPVEC